MFIKLSDIEYHNKMVDKKIASQELQEWKKNFEKDWEEQIKTMNEMIKESEKQKDFQDIFSGEIKAWGGSGHIIIPKRYIGRNCRVLILNKKEEGGKSKG